MTHLKHIHGRHYILYEGEWLAVCLLALTGIAIGLKATPKYITKENL